MGNTNTTENRTQDRLHVVGFLCSHPNKPARLIRNRKNADKYANQYLSGIVTIEPLVLERECNAAKGEAA